MTPSKKKLNVSKNQWLEKALEVLESQGHNAVKIDRLAKLLGVSRSGFYWHFKNRQDLLKHLLDYWTDEFTSVLIENQDIKKLDAKTRLLTAMQTIRNEKLTKYDLAMFTWARTDAMVDAGVKRVISMRLDFSRELYSALGFEGAELEMRARLFTCYDGWEEVTFPDDPEGIHTKLQELRFKMLVG